MATAQNLLPTHARQRAQERQPSCAQRAINDLHSFLLRARAADSGFFSPTPSRALRLARAHRKKAAASGSAAMSEC
jgi:hypothetical protein